MEQRYLLFYTEMQRALDSNDISECFNGWEHMINKWNSEANGQLLRFVMLLSTENANKFEQWLLETKYPEWKRKYDEYYI